MKMPSVRFLSFFAALLVLVSGVTASAQTFQKQYRLIKDGTGYKLEITDAPVRQPGTNEVLIKMHAASLNRRDISVMKGQYPVGGRESLVPLSDGAGEVVAIGPGAKRFKVGARVMPIFFQTWLSGRPSGDIQQFALGGSEDGVLTQYMTIKEDGVVTIPAGMSYEEAATLPCVGVTAWNGLFTRGHLKAGDYALFEGTGGVSVFGLQLAVAAGAKGIITSSSDDKLVRAKALGAIGTINYRKIPDWERIAIEITKGEGVQHVLEVGGKDSLAHGLASLSTGGHIALIGGLGGFGGEIPALALMTRNITVSGIYVGSRADFEALNAFLEQHRIKPTIDKVFDYKDARAAFDLMESGEFFGKIVIRI
jgi:NADPH:quinone reductase-like Zn-dependent oxidoreductase